MLSHVMTLLMYPSCQLKFGLASMLCNWLRLHKCKEVFEMKFSLGNPLISCPYSHIPLNCQDGRLYQYLKLNDYLYCKKTGYLSIGQHLEHKGSSRDTLIISLPFISKVALTLRLIGHSAVAKFSWLTGATGLSSKLSGLSFSSLFCETQSVCKIARNETPYINKLIMHIKFGRC